MNNTREVVKTLYAFWSSFGLPAYPEYNVPDDAQLPYITYDVRKPNWRGAAPYSARVWYRDTSYEAIVSTVDEISQAIGEGIRLRLGQGAIYLFKEDLFFQMQPTEADEDNLKVAYLQMTIHALAW